MLRKVLYVVGGLFFTALFVTAVVLGVWAYNLNTKLTQSQADNQALQSKYENLSVEYAQAQDDIQAQSTQAQADLTKAGYDLSAAQAQINNLEGDLKKANDENAKLNAKLTEIRSKVEILNAFWFSTKSSFERKVNASDDEQLMKLYDAFAKSQNSDTYVDLMSYMIESIADACEIY